MKTINIYLCLILIGAFFFNSCKKAELIDINSENNSTDDYEKMSFDKKATSITMAGYGEATPINPLSPLPQNPINIGQHIDGILGYNSQWYPTGAIHSEEHGQRSQFFPGGSFHSTEFLHDSKWYPPGAVHSTFLLQESDYYPPGSTHSNYLLQYSNWYPPGTNHGVGIFGKSEFKPDDSDQSDQVTPLNQVGLDQTVGR